MPLRVLAVGLLIVWIGLTNPARGQGSDDTLQVRVEALTAQVRIRYGAYPPAQAARIAVIRTVLNRWNEATPAGTQAAASNRARINAWLDAALRSVMPGGSGQMPNAPSFEPFVTVQADQAAPSRPAGETDSRPIKSVLRNTPKPLVPRPPLAARTSPPTLSAGQASKAAANRTPGRRSSPVRPGKSRSVFLGPRLTERSTPPIADTPGRDIPIDGPAAQAKPDAQVPQLARAVPPDPFVDDPDASPNPLRHGTQRLSRRPATAASAFTPIDLGRLSAEIRGYNAAVRELQGRVMRLDRTDLDGLAESADELDRLGEKRGFLDLYRNGLSQSERNRLPPSPSADLVRELARRRALDLMRRTPPERRAERRALQKLNERLARQGRTAANF